MLRKRIQPWIDWLKHVVTEPRDELNRWQAAVRFAYELAVHGWKALNRDDAPQMAAALAFRTLFALLPVMVVSTVVVRAVRGEEGFLDLINKVIDAFALRSIPFGQNESLGSWLESLVRGASGLNLAALGWIGLAIVIYSAIGLLVTIENGFNKIYGAPEGRSWVRRVPTYWLLLTMSPVFVGITLVINNRFNEWIGNVQLADTWRWVLAALKFFWGFVVSWLFMFGVYKLVPNTKVANRAALAGGFIASVLLTIGKSSLNAYFQNAVSLESLYGSLGAIPLFMFWVYLMWLAVLFGLEVAATIQTVTMQGRALQEVEQKRPQNGLVDPTSVVSVMEVITERFVQSKPATTREIADETLITEGIVCQIIDRLHQAGLVHRLERQESSVSLARPPDQIPAESLIDIGYSLVDEGGTGKHSAFVQRLRAAQKRLARHATLGSLQALDGAPAATNHAIPS